MTVTVVALVFIGLLSLALRFGTDTPRQSWRPPSDWRERDPRS